MTITQEEMIINELSVALRGARTLQISQRTDDEWLVRWSRESAGSMEFGTHVAIIRGGEVAFFWGDYCGFDEAGRDDSLKSFASRKGQR